VALAGLDRVFCRKAPSLLTAMLGCWMRRLCGQSAWRFLSPGKCGDKMAFDLNTKFIETKEKLSRVRGFRTYPSGKTYPAATTAEVAAAGAAFLKAGEALAKQKVIDGQSDLATKAMQLVRNYKNAQPLSRLGLFSLTGSLGSEYPYNADFWRETGKFAIGINAIGFVPGQWSLMAEAWQDQFKALDASGRRLMSQASDAISGTATWLLKWVLFAALGYGGFVYLQKQLRS
jgi:hypothetical protein